MPPTNLDYLYRIESEKKDIFIFFAPCYSDILDIRHGVVHREIAQNLLAWTLMNEMAQKDLDFMSKGS